MNGCGRGSEAARAPGSAGRPTCHDRDTEGSGNAAYCAGSRTGLGEPASIQHRQGVGTAFGLQRPGVAFLRRPPGPDQHPAVAGQAGLDADGVRLPVAAGPRSLWRRGWICAGRYRTGSSWEGHFWLWRFGIHS